MAKDINPSDDYPRLTNRSQGGLTSTETDRVKRIVLQHLGLKEWQIFPEANFYDDLGADSLDLVELIFALEDEFDIDFPDEDVEKITKVGQVIQYIENRIG